MKRLLLLLPFFVAGTPALASWGNQEPWAIPKGDARTDCAVYKTKNKPHDSFVAARARALNFSLEKVRTLQLENKMQKEIDEGLLSDKNPLPEAENKENEAYTEVQLAQTNVL